MAATLERMRVWTAADLLAMPHDLAIAMNCWMGG